MNIEEAKSNLAANLKKLRKAKGMTQSDLANIAGISQDSISRYELSLDKPPLDKLVILANTFKITLDELVGFKKIDTDEHDIPFNILKKARVICKLPTRARNEVIKFINDKARKAGVE